MKYLIACIMLFSSLFAAAQNSLSGKITDKSNNTALPGATVYIPELKKGASANAEGAFIIKNLPEGKFLIEVHYIGYNTVIQNLVISGSTTQNFALEASVTEITEIVVTGVSKATEIRQSPVPTLIVPKSVLLEQANTNLIDGIARQPGVSQLSTGAAVSKPVIRGLGYNRIVTLNNGLRQEGQQWGDEHGIEIDEYSVDRTEIIKGPGTLMYGSDAMAGVINFLAPQPVNEGTIMGNVLANYQTNNRLAGFSAMAAGNNGGISWLARVSQKQAAAYTNKYDGRVYNSGYDEINANGMVGIDRKWGYSHLSFSTFNQNIGMVEGERDSMGNFLKLVAVDDTTAEEATATTSDLSTYNLSVPRQQVNHHRVALQNLFILNKARLAVNFSYQQNQRREFGDILAPNIYSLYFLLSTFTYDVRYYLPEMRGWETTVGFNGMYQQNQNKGREFIIPAYRLFDYGLFAITRKNFGRLSVSGGIRGDERILRSEALYFDSTGAPTTAGNSAETKFAAFDKLFSNLTGSVGATYNISSKFLVKVNFSKGFRAPNMAELGSNGRHEGTLRYEYGNSSLKPETSLQADLGINYRAEHVTVDASVFQSHIQNYIYAKKLRATGGGDSIVDTDDPAPAYQYTQGDATLTGGEIAIDFHPHPLDWLHFQNSFSYVQGVNNGQSDSSKHLPFMPPARYQGELRANFKKATKYITNPYVFVQFDHFFRQDKILKENNTETITPGYSLVNAGAGGAITSKKGRTVFNIYFTVTNVLDVAYQNHLSRLKYAAVNPATGRMGVFNMGRNFSIKIVVPLVFKK